MESQSENQTKNRRGKYRSKENRSFTCDLCDRMYIERNNLLQHYNIKHPEAKTAVCDHCNKLQYPQLMTSHVQRCRTRLKNLRHAGKNQTPIRGKYKKRDPTREKVVSRVKSKGLCPICGVERSQSHIKDHLERQASDNKPFICDICGSKLSSRIGIFFHMQVQHLKIPFKCRYCDKEFRTSQQVETHTRKIHPEHKKVLKCDFCEYTTDYHTSLRTHRAKHTGKTFHKCNICGKEFIQKEKYNFHVALHSEERNFACEICGARFKTRRYVKVHQRTHFEKNYECPVCQKTFSANQLMTNHVKNKHPEYQLPPPGTIMSKSYRKLMAEKKLKEEAMRKGADQRTVDAIVVHEAPPIEELHMIQSFGARHD
ncbi:zinc finger protein 226-like [Culicoides brevitarsis]|uniref:zinc finger protein 226-like n=1 Tax=Culicoides brevitarsis TaxID=469753 RepID=UPI00307B1743